MLTPGSNPPGGGGGGVTKVTSTGGTVTVTNPTGPTTNVEVETPIVDSAFIYLSKVYA